MKRYPILFVVFLMACIGAAYTPVAEDVISPKDFGAIGDGVADDYEALRDFFAHVEANDVGTASVAGTYVTSQPLVYGALIPPKTQSFAGTLSLIVTGTHDAVLTIKGWRDGSWQGLKIRGPGNTNNYASRTCAVGILLDGTQRCSFDTIRAESFSFAGIVAGINNTSVIDYGNIRAINCGSGARNGTFLYGLKTTWSNPVNTGGNNSVGQRTTIDVTVLPPASVTDGSFGAPIGEMPCMIRIAGRLYFIYGVDAENSKLTVFPWVDATATPGEVDYVYGGGLCLIGNDSNVSRFSGLDALRCGVGLSVGSIYGPQGNRLISQFCGTALCIGPSPSNACLGGQLIGAYFENNSEDIIWLNRTGGSSWFAVEGDYALNLNKSYVAGNPRTTNNQLSTNFEAIARGRFTHEARVYEPEKASRNGTNGLSSQTVFINRPDQVHVICRDSVTVTPSLNESINRLTGIDSLRVIVMGTGMGGSPTGTVTLNAQSGWTVNGGASAQFNSTDGPVTIVLQYQFASKNIIANAMQ